MNLDFAATTFRGMISILQIGNTKFTHGSV